ncbi:MAG: hypothetical protein ABSC19_12960 [Syntrophorhabdales bacterium]|jgi:hypothetical protein
MEGSAENDKGNVKREKNAKRQRTYRRRKKEQGRYVYLFVPTEVARKIKGKPALLGERFAELSEVMDRLEQQDKEIRELRSRIEIRKISLSLRFEKRLIAKRFGEFSEKDLLMWANDERRRLAELLAEERNESERVKKRVYAILDAAGGLAKKALDESEDYLDLIRAVNSALLNPRIKNEQRKAMAIERIRRQCKAAIESGAVTHEANNAACRRLFDRWSPDGLYEAVDPL